MKYEESILNRNKNGKQSIILELRKEFRDFLDVLQEYDILDTERTDPEIGVLLILAGECCEGDYIVTTDENESHDFDALVQVIAAHDIEIDVIQLKELYDKLKPFLWKRAVTWS